MLRLRTEDPRQAQKRPKGRCSPRPLHVRSGRSGYVLGGPPCLSASPLASLGPRASGPGATSWRSVSLAAAPWWSRRWPGEALPGHVAGDPRRAQRPSPCRALCSRRPDRGEPPPPARPPGPRCPGQARSRLPARGDGFDHARSQCGGPRWLLPPRYELMADSSTSRPRVPPGPVECDRWATCLDLAAMGWTASRPCGWCADLVTTSRCGRARDTGSPAVDPALLATADGSAPWPSPACAAPRGSCTCSL